MISFDFVYIQRYRQQPLNMLLLLATIATLCGMSTAQYQSCVCVTTSSFDSPLNVRDAPNGNVIGSVYPNECMVSTDNCPGGWCQVQFNGGTAYVSLTYVSGPQICGDPDQGTCMSGHCGNRANDGRTCDAYGCGHYGAPRGSRLHEGTDVVCSPGDNIIAPFDGTVIRAVPPYGDGSCCDNGFEYESTDPDYPGLYYVVFYADGYSVGSSHSKGDVIANHIGLICGCYPSSMTDHSHVAIYDSPTSTSPIDPTSFIYCNYK